MEQVARTETCTKSGHYWWAVLFSIVGVILAVRAWSKSEVGPGFALYVVQDLIAATGGTLEELRVELDHVAAECPDARGSW